MDKKIFWSDKASPNGKYQSGIYFRAFDLVKFMKLVEKDEGEVVGLCFEDNNVDIIIKKDEKNKNKLKS